MSIDSNIPDKSDPTLALYGALQYIFDYFNKNLFEERLPKCIITFHRQRRVMGYASHKRWKNATGTKVDEIAINPEYFDDYPLIEIFQTICHEMTHLWQSHYGSPSRRGYHNKEWSYKMQEIGLMPSSTGEPGGQEIGEHMMDYVILDGPFMKACQDLIKNHYDFPWIDCFPIVRQETPILAYRKDNTPVELEKSLALKPKNKKLISNDGIQKSSESSSLIDENGLMPWEKIEATQSPVLHSTKAVHKSGKIKYTCKRCKSNVWGKPSLNIGCLDCNIAMTAVD
jgi:predicted SprT family Zn-dependent metalloprotease